MTPYRQFTSQEEIDREYNVGAAVPGAARWLDWHAQEGARARHDLACAPDLRFGPTLDETVDVFPAEHPGAAILVFIHGGYWRWGSSEDFSLVARGPVSRGLTVVVTNYSLCPKVGLPGITRQSRAVIAWLCREGRRVNGDPERSYVAGHSAGGQQVGRLAATYSSREYGLPSDIIKGGLSISGIFDLHPLRYSFLLPKVLLTHQVILRESLLFNIPPIGPRLLVSVGNLESAEFHRQSTEYLDAWKANGLQGHLLIQEGNITSPLSRARPTAGARCVRPCSTSWSSAERNAAEDQARRTAQGCDGRAVRGRRFQLTFFF